MGNLKRNEPCRCGSGKKYKKCCGISNVIEISPKLYNDELYDLHDDLLAYALANYEHKFIEQSESHFQPFLSNDKNATEAYLTGLTFWMILNVPILDNGQTIFAAFYNQQKGKIKRTRTRNTFSEWANTAPSVYEVLSIDHEKTQMITIAELITNEEFQVPILEEVEFLEDSMIIGSLVPFVGHHYFFFNTLEVFSDEKEMIISLMKEFSQEEDQFQKEFPDFLAAVLLPQQHVIEWDYPSYKMVADLFTQHMIDKGIDEETIAMGVVIWHRYTSLEQPTLKKPAAYAAALEYLVHRIIINDLDVTQKQIAKEYDTTAGTISTNYRKIIHSIDENAMFENLLDEPDFDPIEEVMSMSPRDTAQNILFKAQQEKGKKRHQLIEEALAIYPNSADAYILLAEDAHSESAYEQFLRKAVLAGEKDLGKAFFLKNKGHFWLINETRPYMRAKEMYANFLYEIGDGPEALKHYSEMLRLNPNDNQGIRYTLLTLYIEVGQFSKAEELIRQFSDEAVAAFLFNKIVVDYFTNGITNQTKKFIKEANKQNPFVKDYLLGKKEIPDQEFDYINFGDETEAIVYAQEHIHIWEAMPELLKMLNE